MITITRGDIKTLNQFVNEPNEFKRYILTQLWINQLYSKTITDIIKSVNNPSSTNNDIITDETIFNIFRDVKSNLACVNENIKKVLIQQQNNYDLMKVMNALFELNSNNELQQLNDELTKLKTTIKTNEDYINKINNLSENQISSIRNNNNEN